MSNEQADQAVAVALQHHRAGRLPEAEAIYRRVLAADPNHADALHLLGVLAYQSGHAAAAAPLIERAIRINPAVAEYHSNLGEVLFALGQADAAEASYSAAILRDSRCVAAHAGLATLLQVHQRMDEAIVALRAAVAALPDNGSVHSDLAVALARHGRGDEALAEFARAIELDPNNADIHTNHALALHLLGRHDQALAAARRAVELRPGHADAQMILGTVLQSRGEIEPALSAFRAALAARPGDARMHSALLLAMHYAAPIDPSRLYAEHLEWDRRHAAPLTRSAAPFENDRDPERRLRIGFVSGDFRTHSVAFFIEPLLAAHDRSTVEAFAYSSVSAPDETTARLRELTDQWRNVSPLSDAQLAEQVRRDRIDILIDLAGHTERNRLLTFARKAAPVQVTYLGYPDTTGVRAIDFRLTDAIADPADADRFHVERLIRLPRCAWCYRPPEAAPEPSPRRDGAITFASFNNLAKISPQTMDLWANVLTVLPESRLLLKSAALADASVQARVEHDFAARGVHADRLLFRGYAPTRESHLSAYHEADIALDTFPYHGTTTTCEALWMGVPVITLAGTIHLSRVGASLLHAVGLDEFVADSPARYVELAAALASDLPRLTQLRADLRPRVSGSPLTDAASLAREVERAYRSMWRNWCGKSV